MQNGPPFDIVSRDSLGQSLHQLYNCAAMSPPTESYININEVEQVSLLQSSPPNFYIQLAAYISPDALFSQAFSSFTPKCPHLIVSPAQRCAEYISRLTNLLSTQFLPNSRSLALPPLSLRWNMSSFVPPNQFLRSSSGMEVIPGSWSNTRMRAAF
jgi:hypothetical protein